MKKLLVPLAMLILGFTTAPSYAIEVVSCSGLEACPDGSPPFTNAFLNLAAEVEALTAEVEALKALLADVTRGTDPNTSQDTLTFSGMNVQVVNDTGQTSTANGTGNLIIGYNELRGGDDGVDC